MKGQNNRSSSRMGGHRHSQSRSDVSNGYDQSNTDGAFGNERIINLVEKAIGKQAVVTVRSGVRYQGLLVDGDLSTIGASPLSVVLSNPVEYSKGPINEKSNRDKGLPETFVIQGDDLIDLEVSDLDVIDSTKKTPTSSKESPIPETKSVASKFKTDSDISRRTPFKERELKMWTNDLPDNGPSLSLDDETFGHDTGHWDQFKVNEEKFGVESTYDEHFYTTRINTSAPDYHEKVAKADKIASEIESQASNSRHVLEERGLQVDDSGLDEEDKYSGVDRRGNELMAALKNSSISGEKPSALDSQKGTGKYVPPKQRAAHYHNDPAIVSSSAIEKNSKSRESEKQPAKKLDQNHALPKPDSIPPKPPVVGQQIESFRLNAQSEINSLREFSANFKIPHRMPTDLLPILSKDKIKQDEILKKQDNEKKTKEEVSDSNHQSTSVSQKKKMDPAKPAFKLNPKAAAFTPLNRQSQSSPSASRASFVRSPNRSNSRLNSQRPPSSGTSSVSTKRHHQISPADFFGGSEKVPTVESQKEKLESFKVSFNLFLTAKKHSKEKNNPIIFEKTFQTPPTWDSTFDESHDKLFPSSGGKSAGMGIPASPFIPSPLMAAPNVPVPGGYSVSNGGSYQLSPQNQQAAAAMAVQFQQQQQYQAAMLYQQQFGGVPVNQGPVPMFSSSENQFFPPAGFVSPQGAYIGSGSPVNANVLMGSGSFHYPGQGTSHHNKYNNPYYHGNRRYNNDHSQSGTSSHGSSGSSHGNGHNGQSSQNNQNKQGNRK